MRISALPGVDLPVVQAPMAGVQDTELAIAVAETGALGSVPCAMLSPVQLSDALQRIAARAARPVNLNFFCHEVPMPDRGREQRWREALAPYYREARIAPEADPPQPARRPIDAGIVALLEPFRPQILSFHFGLPTPELLRRIKSWGARVLASATTVEEGRWLAQRGADVVIAQGIEAGGHRGHFLSGDLSLQPTTRELVIALKSVIDVPIVAAGGIGSRDDARAMFDAGASAVQAGTAYLLCPEATTSAVHRSALRDAGPAGETALTNLFSGRPARGLLNRVMRELGPMSDLAPAFPLASAALAPLRAHAEAQGRGDFSPLWSGTNTGACRAVPAAEVTRSLAGI